MADAEAEARFQEFINRPGSQDSRLRDAFAQLMAMGAGQALPAEAVWAAQGQQQLPPDTMPLIRPREMGDSPTTDLPMRAIDPGPAAELAFPTAPADPRADQHFQPKGGKTDADQAPFHGKGSYVLPKEMRKKGKR
jgi:hypothetical protein